MTCRAFNRRLAYLLGAAAGLAGAAEAQSTLYTFDGDKSNDRLGAAVANAGDFNNDGSTDIVVGAPENQNVFLAGEGYARVYSGADGAVIATFDGTTTQDTFGEAVAGVGDVNNDGWDDIAVGSRLAGFPLVQSGLIRIISGQTQSTLYEVAGLASGEQLGWSIAGCGDVDGDGRDDFVGGAPTAAGNLGVARVFSGLDGSVLHTFTGSSSNGRLGYSVSELDDVNGDGRGDILVGSLFDGVYIFSGLDGSTLKHWTSALSADVFGKAVSGIDDMDGDGVRDVVIGATQENVFPSTPGPGYVQVRSSVSGLVLLTVSGGVVNHRFGNTVSYAGDWNGDSKPDVLVGSVPTNATIDEYAQVLSGVNGAVLATFTGSAAGDGMGFSVAGLGDANQDGKVDVVCGAPDTQPNGMASGRARVFSSTVVACGNQTNYCVAGSNSVSAAGMSIAGVGAASVSGLFFINASNGPGGQPGLFFYGANQVAVPFGNGTRCVGGTLVRLLPTNISGSSGGTGSASTQLDFPNLPVSITPGSTWNFQFWYRDPADGGAFFNLSDAIEITFCP